MQEIRPENETRENKIKRLAMRSMRRGTKEMDLILMRFADARLSGMTDDQLAHYDDLLSENDQDLYKWISGQDAAPSEFSGLISEIAAQEPVK